MTFDNYTLKQLEASDAKALYEMMKRNKERLVDYFRVSVGAAETIGSTKNYIMQKAEEARNKEAYTFMVRNDDNKALVGTLFIKNIDWRIPKAEMAYYIDKDYEGKGVTTKALKAVISYAFNTLNINKLFIRAAKDNVASQRVALKNGFVLEGILRNDFKISDNSLIDTLYYGLVRK